MQYPLYVLCFDSILSSVPLKIYFCLHLKTYSPELLDGHSPCSRKVGHFGIFSRVKDVKLSFRGGGGGGHYVKWLE